MFIERLGEMFNSSNKGHSEYGIGVRTAATHLISKTDEVFFYVTDGIRGIKYKHNKTTDALEECFYLFGSDEREPEERIDNEAEEKFNEFPSFIDEITDTKITKWII